jgi:uncharacterized protein YbaR (Trm112 family)
VFGERTAARADRYVDPFVPVALLEILRCPLCRAELREGAEEYVCSGCSRHFGRTTDGIPLMLHEDLPGARAKLGETAGWVEKARSEGWYEPDDAVDAVLPFVNRDLGWNDSTWRANAYSFENLFNRYLPDARGLRVLEVGAAKSWAGRFWLERDCTYVATDILVDSKIGLGRGSFYGDFARVQADGEHLPFVDGAFDVTYCLATLHHALDLTQMVREMSRVTRTRGLVAAMNEGTRGLGRNTENPDQATEKSMGINEHVHTVWAYAGAFFRAGLTVRRMERADGWPPLPFGYLLSKIPKIGMTMGTVTHLSAARFAGVSIYARKRGGR